MNNTLFQEHPMPRWRSCCGWIALLLLVGLGACQDEDPAPPDKLVFWRTTNVDAPEIYSANIRYGQVPVNQSNTDLSVSQIFQLGFTLDRMNRKIYFFSTDSLIRQLDFDLKNLKVAGNLGKNGGFGTNADNGNVGDMLFSENKLYWSQVAPSRNQLVRANLNGSNREVLYTATSIDSIGDRGLARQEGNPAFYWGTSRRVWRGNADGSGSPRVLYDLAADTTRGELNDLAVWKDKIYLATTQGLWVGRADGTGGLTRLFVNETKQAKDVGSVSIDAVEEQLYWFSKITPQPIDGKDYQFLYRGNPDGTASRKLLERYEGTQLQVF